MSTETAAAEFLKKYEGYTGVAIWDVNAWRIGHGSDTHTDPNGSIRTVQQGDTTTPKDAQRDLERRIRSEFIPKIINKLGADTWNNLPQGARVAFVSLAYNYGNVTKLAIIAAAKSGNMANLAKTWITSTYNDNKSLPENIRNALRNRRAAEAALIQPTDAKKKGLLIAAALLITAAIVSR